MINLIEKIVCQVHHLSGLVRRNRRDVFTQKKVKQRIPFQEQMEYAEHQDVRKLPLGDTIRISYENSS